jgi:hypothetical protein
MYEPARAILFGIILSSQRPEHICTKEDEGETTKAIDRANGKKSSSHVDKGNGRVVNDEDEDELTGGTVAVAAVVPLLLPPANGLPPPPPPPLLLFLLSLPPDPLPPEGVMRLADTINTDVDPSAIVVVAAV